ncbi:Protein MAIN-LIKE 2 [Glycine soja]
MNKKERITELMSHGLATEYEFPAQEFNILQSSVETQGIADEGRLAWPWNDYTPPTFSQYPVQMYQYPFEGHQSDISVSEHSLGDSAKTYPNFSWPTMTPQQHDALIPTPNAPLGTQWNGSSQSISFLILVDFGRPFARIVLGSRISVHKSSEGGIAASFPRGHYCIFWYMINSVITVLYFNGRVYEENDESLDEDDSVDGISDTDDEVTHMIEPVTIVQPREGVEGIQNPFWNDVLHYNNINWSHPDEEDICVAMTSSSSSSSHINIKSGPIDTDVLWMQPKHVSEHVWNGEEERKLHIRRVVPTYQGKEQIPEQIFPFLQQSGFGWIIKMGYLKINVSLISALIERWRPETHTFHMRCGECTITLQDVSVLLGISVDGLPLIGPTNLDWAYLCEELLGVRPQEGEIKGSVIKLSWLAHHFDQINNDDDEEQVRRFARAWILRFIGGVLFVDKTSNRVSLRYLQFLRDFEECSRYAWGAAVLGFLHREMCSATNYKTKSIGGMCILLQLWAWERCPSLTPKRTPSQIENIPLGHRWLRRGNQHIGNDDVKVFRRKLDIMKRHEVRTMLLRKSRVVRDGATNLFPISEFHHAFRVDAYPRQEGLLSFNSDYMVWYRRKTKMFVDPENAKTATLAEVAETLQYMVSPQGRNTWTIDDLVPYVEKITILSEEQERVTEPVSHGPASERQFPAQQFHMLQSSIETQGIDRRRDTVEAEEYSQQMAERGHGMYYTPQTFAEYPTQMYQYPFQDHHIDTSASQQSFGGFVETQAHFSWPTMTPSQQYHGPIPTPNAPLGTQWNVPEQIPNTGDLFGKKRGGIGAEEILIAKHEDRIDHVAHPHGITDTKMNDLHVSIY